MFNREHVIPDAFGTFGSQTPTLLKCVCKGCNDFFARVLDPVLTRDTYEGITRYALGIRSSEARPQKKVQLYIPDTEEYGEFRGARVWIDGTTGLLNMHSQVGFVKEDSGDRVYFTDVEVAKFDLLPPGLSGKNTKILAVSKDDHDRIMALMIERGWVDGNESRTEFGGIEFPEKTNPLIHGTVDEMVRRAIAKVGMNFAAKYIGVDEVLSEKWNRARSFIRYGEGEVKSRASNKPFWGQETDTMRIGSTKNPDAIYNVRVENQKEGIVAVLEFSHAFLHEVILVENGSIAEEKETACAFIPGQEPIMGKKFEFGKGLDQMS